MVKLEVFGKPDFEQLKDWMSDEEVLTNWAGSLFSFPLTTAALEWYIEDTNKKGISEAFVYKVIELETGQTVGHISLGGISYKNRSGRITRVFISPAVRGKGYCKRIITEMLRLGFEELDLHRISLGVYTQNKSAIRCYEVAGFQSEGIQRDVLYKNGSYWSLLEMSVLETDWALMNSKE